APNHEIDVLLPVIDGDGKLVGPVAVAIPGEHVPALRRGLLLLRPQTQIVETFDAIVDADTQPKTRRFAQILVRAAARIAMPGNVRARTRAGIHETTAAERIEHLLVNLGA